MAAVEGFSIRSTDELAIDSLAETIIELGGADVGITYDPLPTDNPHRWLPDIGRAGDELGWAPAVDLESGLARTLEYFRNALAREK